MAIQIIDAGSIEISVTILGQGIDKVVMATPIEISLSISGTFSEDALVLVNAIDITISLYNVGVVSERPRYNWVKWSKIGKLDFTIDESNVAGERPLDWTGSIYEILKLGKSVIVYGLGGVSAMAASGIFFGMQTIHKVGVKCRTAVVGTDLDHYFIDSENRLYRLSSDGLKLLDYSEYISSLEQPRLSLDVNLNLLYICDGVRGFIYSVGTNSFGEGPPNITGIGYFGGSLHVVSDGDIEIPKLDICTDIYDLGNRNYKTIRQVEIGTDLIDRLYAMVEMRVKNNDKFIQSNWILVNPSGIAYVPCYGVEFKFCLRSYIHDSLELDYIRVLGVVHGAGYLESQ